MNFLSTTAECTVQADTATAFEHIVPVDLSTLFTGYAGLPAVSGVHHQVGAWDAPGQTRTVLLSDGSAAHEQLTAYDHPRRFCYTVSGFTGTLRLLARSARGEWQFGSIGPDTTHITWRYTFGARSVFAVPVLCIVTHLLWRRYMRQAMRLAKAQIEQMK